MAWMVVKGEYADYQVLHVFEELEGENGAQRWAEEYNDGVGYGSCRAQVEEIGLTRSGEVPPPVYPLVVDGDAWATSPRLLIG